MLTAGIACSILFAAPIEIAQAADEDATSDEPKRHSIHEYTVRVRPTAWTVFVDGEYQTDTSFGGTVSVKIDGDLGYDDPYPTFSGEASFRYKRHDFWINGVYFDETETDPINVEFVTDGGIFNIGGTVDSDVSITDVNFRYGYSFFEFEEDGFRLGPTIAVSYTDIDVKITELTVANIPTGTQASYEETLPVPTLGAHLEIPFGKFMFATQFGGFWVDTGDFEATGIRAETGFTWRPARYIGIYAGLNLIYADVEWSGEEIDDLLLFGPAVGLEFRY